MSEVLKWALASGETALVCLPFCWAPLHWENFSAQICWRREGGEGGTKQSELGFWESLAGNHSFCHCGSVTLTFGHGEGEKRVNSILFSSCHTFFFCHCSQFPETAVIEPTNNMNMHDKSAFLLCPLSCIFFPTQRPVVLCLIGPDIWKGPWVKRKKNLFMTTGEPSLQQSKNGILKGAQLPHIWMLMALWMRGLIECSAICTLSVCRHTIWVRFLLVVKGASTHFINWLCGVSFFFYINHHILSLWQWTHYLNT